ncbi:MULTISPECIES: GIY-YIG nuclease family protein [Streptomyces]|uniref:GIY-YIG nuclease family protein n=1 Tax=Streptomyces TaxID=1883 RepID=UPI001EFCC7FE|nr:GIY-YIG nuclease family protein [Streptomyces sp. CBG31]
MRVHVLTADISVADHEFRDISLTVSHPRKRPGDAETPGPRTDIGMRTVIEMLQLVEKGALSATALLATLQPLLREAESEDERDVEEVTWTASEAPLRRTPADLVRSDPRSVYVVSSEAEPKMIKIGVSKDVRARRRTLQSGSGSPLVVRWTSPGGGYLEGRLHQCFVSRAVGREWFDFRDAENPLRVIAETAGAVLRQVGLPSPEIKEPFTAEATA